MKEFQGIPAETASGENPKFFYNAIETQASGTMMSYRDAYLDLVASFPTASEMEIATTANGAVVIGHARAHGKKFIFSDKLKDALFSTDTPKDIPEIRLPFKALIIEEWCIAEIDGVIRGIRMYGEGKLDFMRFNASENYHDVREKYSGIINMILYLTSEKPDLERAHRKPQKVKGVKRSTISNEVIYVGRKYKGQAVRVKDGSRSLNIRFLVRGHWKNAAIKGGHKRIFIEPHFRGPDTAEVVEKAYKVV